LNSKTILAIDIGSTKVCSIIAEDSIDGLRIIGAGVDRSQGLRKGTITNIELASRSIKNSLEDAKRVAGEISDRAIVSISGAYAKSIDSSGIVNIPNKEIGIKEINRVMQTALYNANIPKEYDVLHALPYNFKVDEQEFVEDPLGMNASRLEVHTHIIITQKSNLNNLKRAVEASGVQVENIILNSYASSIATVNHDDKTLGVAVIDIGGSTSNFVIHAGGNSVRYNGFLPVGANNITQDLSLALHTPVNVAENVKVTYGNLNFYHSPDDMIELPVIGDEQTTHEVSLDLVHQVIDARVSETLSLVSQKVEASGLKKDIGAGIILTGGLTKLEGIRDLAMQIFDLPVRLAKPKDMNGLFESLRDPAFSTAIGLILHAAGYYSQYEFDSNRNMRHNNEEEDRLNEVSLDDIKGLGGANNNNNNQKRNQKPQKSFGTSEVYGIEQNNIPNTTPDLNNINMGQQNNYSQTNKLRNGNTPQGSNNNYQGGYGIKNNYIDEGLSPAFQDPNMQKQGQLSNRIPQNQPQENGIFTKTWQWINQLF
jgi:cell division protein FtsA